MIDNAVKQNLLVAIREALIRAATLDVEGVVQVIKDTIATNEDVLALVDDKLTTPKIVNEMIVAATGLLDLNAPENASLLSRVPEVFSTVRPGTYNGFVRASALGLAAEHRMVFGVQHDPMVEVSISICTYGDNTFATRQVKVGSNCYHCDLRDNLLDGGGLIALNWTKKLTHWDSKIHEFLNPTHLSDLTTMFQQVGEGLIELDPTTPDASGITARPYIFDYSAMRTFTGGVFFAVFPGVGKWYVIAAPYKMGSTSVIDQAALDRLAIKYNWTILSSGDIVEDGTAIDNQQIEVSCEILSGEPVNNYLKPGQWTTLRRNSSSCTLGVLMEQGADSWNPVTTKESVVRILFRNKSSAVTTSAVIRLAVALDQRALPSDAYAPAQIGTWGLEPWNPNYFPLFNGSLYQGNELVAAGSDSKLMLAVGRTKIPATVASQSILSLLPDPETGHCLVHETNQKHQFEVDIGFKYTGLDEDEITSVYECQLDIEHSGQKVTLQLVAESGELALKLVGSGGELTDPKGGVGDKLIWGDLKKEVFTITGAYTTTVAMAKGLQYFFPNVTYAEAYGSDKLVSTGIFTFTSRLKHKALNAVGDTSRDISLTTVVDSTVS